MNLFTAALLLALLCCGCSAEPEPREAYPTKWTLAMFHGYERAQAEADSLRAALAACKASHSETLYVHEVKP